MTQERPLNIDAQESEGTRGQETDNVQAMKSETGQTVENATVAAGTQLPADLANAYLKLVNEKDALYDQLLRRQAEFENFRKRTQREKEDFLQHATADLIRTLLPALDGFERAFKHRDPNVPGEFYEGFELIHRQLLDALQRAGMTTLDASGQIFDPHLHQAVETAEVPDARDHEIVEEVQRGYKLRNRLLRPAMVKVAVRPKQEEAEVGSEENKSN
jgi:molecular chaperone GrpE